MKQTITRFCQVSIGLILCLVIAHGVRAQTPMHFTPTGTSNNVFPLGSTTNMVQWVFLPADFTSTIPGNSFITTIYLRPASGNTPTTTTYSNLQIKMGSTTATAMAGGTWVGGLTTVLNSATHVMSPPAVAGGWIPFVLSTPFYYNGGNFYLEISQSSYTGSGLTIAQDGAATNRRQWGTVGSGSASSFGSGLVTLGVDVIPADCSGQPSPATFATPAFNPATPLCIGGTTSITGINPNLGTGLSVFWQTSASPTGPWTAVAGGSGATTLTYTTPPISANTYFRMGVNCSFSNLNSYSAAYLVPVGAPQPGVMSGSSTFCPGDPETYSVPNVPGTTYTWTLPAGWAGSSTTNSITVTPGTAPGNISVIATSPCGVSIPRTRAIVAGSSPAPPASITGNRFICSNTAQTYSVSPVAGALSYNWALPGGWTGTSTTNSITVSNTTTSGNVSVRAVNGCGQSLATVIPVSVISALANPGTITGKDTVCSGGLQTYSIQPVNGATSYVWTLPAGWSGTTTGTSVQVFGGTASGSITVTAYVSCATSPISSKALTAVTTITPTISLSTPPATLCQGTPYMFTATATGGGSNPRYIWRRNGSVISNTGSTYNTNTLVTGETVSVTLRSNAVCASVDSVTTTPVNVVVTPSVVPGISINTVPITAICRGMNMTLTAVATGGGPGPTYQWMLNGVAIPSATGLTYSSTTLNDQDTVSVFMTSDALCATQPSANSNRVGIVVADELVPSISISVSPSEVLVPGDEVTFTSTQSNGGATPDYQWLLNGVKIPFANSSTFTTSELLPDDHISVRMLSYLSCAMPKVAVSNRIKMLKDPVSVTTAAAATQGMSLYPNPTSGKLSLRGEAPVTGGLRIEVLSAIGQVVHRVEMVSGSATANWRHELELPSSLADGHYLLRVSTHQEGAQQTMATIPFILSR